MAAQDVQGMLVRIEATTAQLRAEMKRADAAVGNATKGIDKQLTKVDGAFGRLETGAGKAASAIRTLAPALAGLATIEALRRTQQLGEEFTLLEARVKRLSGGTAEAAVTYARLAEVARNSGTSLGETVKLWESLTGTLQEMGATDAQVVRLTDTLQKIGAIGGSSAQEVSGALRQLGQGLAGGVLRAEEFNSVIEGMPELAREIARGLGVPFGELRQLMLDGELTADKVLGAIQRRAYDVDAEFAKLPRTVSQASAALTNDLGRAISSLDSAIGGSQFLAKFLDTLAKGIRLTAGDLTDFERLNELVAERAQIQLRYEQAQRRTLLSDKERATFENSLKRLNAEIAEIQDRRIAQIKEEGRAISANAPVINEQYDKYLARLKESAALQGVSSEVAKVRYAIEKGELGKLTEAQQASLLKYAAEKDAKIEAQKAGLHYSQGLKEQAKVLQDLAAKYDPAAKAQAEYEKGIALADKALRDGTYTTEQYQKVVQGLYTDLNKPIWDKHNKQAKEAADAIKKIDDQLESVRDRLDPVRAATKRLTAEKKLLKEALDENLLSFDEYQLRLQQLDKEYEQNTRATSEWAQWTEGALDRVDSAFADAWRNIGDGFSSFRDSLTNAFKQMLAELIHMATTQKIVMQIGAALGIGGGAGAATSLLGGGGSGGGFDIGQLLNYGQTAYSMFTGVGPAVMAGWQSGGLTGAIQGGAGYYGNLASSAWNTAAGWFGGSAAAGAGSAAGTGFGYGQSLVSGQIGNAAYAGAQAGAGSSLSGIAGNLGAIVGPIVGLYTAIKGYGAISDGYDFKPKDFDDDLYGVRLGAKVINAYENGITKVLGDSSFLSKALRIPVATIGGLMSSVFGGGWETKNYGLAFSVANGDFLGQSYEDQKKKGGWFSSNKKRTIWSDLDPETAAALQETYDATESTVSGLLARIGVSVNDGALDGLEIARRKISTKGKTEEEIQAAIAEWFEFAGDRMIAEIDKGIGGFGYSLAELTQRINVFESVNDALELINVAVLDLSAHSMELANGMAEAAGGMDAFSTGISAYYGSFFSAAEQQEKVFASLVETFAEAEQVLAASRQDYRDMVEAIDVTTEAGRNLFNTLMGLATQADAYYDILESRAAEAINAAGAAFSGLQAAINAEVGQLQTQYQAAQASANGLLQLSNSLQSALRSMRMDSDAFDRMRRQQAQAQLSAALATGRAGGSLRGMDLSDALSELGRANTDLFGSFEEYARDYWRTAHDINSLDQLAGKQLSVEEKTLAAIESQISYYDQMLLDAQNELNALMGIDTSVQSVAAALANFKVAVGAAEAAKNAAAPKTAKQTIADTYQSVFGRDAGSGEVNYWLQRIGEGTATTGNLADLFKTSDEYKNGGFATGGYTGAGGKWEPAGIVHKGEVVWSQSDIAKWGGVGAVEAMRKGGPELEVTGPSRIYNASQTAAMLGGGGDAAAEVRALRTAIHTDLQSIAKHTMNTAKRLDTVERMVEDWDINGLPKERGAA